MCFHKSCDSPHELLIKSCRDGFKRKYRPVFPHVPNIYIYIYILKFLFILFYFILKLYSYTAAVPTLLRPGNFFSSD